jgi:CRISPR-associated protein Csb1
LTSVVTEHAAFRRRLRLQPVGGRGDKIFPPTYPGDNGAHHVFERRRVDGSDVWTVLLDSVQSSSNRAEEALLAEVRAGQLELPLLSVDFTSTNVPEIGTITSLDAPHRIFDAILRDSTLGGQPLMHSDLGKRLQLAKMSNAAAILESSPTALLFGAWNSTGEGGGLGAKFPRAFVSEIVGIHVPVDVHDGNVENAGRRTGSRIDPLGVLKGVPVFKSPTDWDTTEINKSYKKSKPSEINHGNIRPSVSDLGVTVDYAEHTVVISFAGLRRLFFGNAERDAAARALLASLGLVAHLAQAKHGYALRSRCDLVPEEAVPFELVRYDGSTQAIDIDLDAALALYRSAVDEVRALGFAYSGAPVQLTPQAKLVELVAKSRELALAGKGGEAEGTDASV